MDSLPNLETQRKCYNCYKPVKQYLFLVKQVFSIFQSQPDNFSSNGHQCWISDLKSTKLTEIHHAGMEMAGHPERVKYDD